ncbi:hypothetical protein Pmani_002310 [Petrolisthes manimaculis]|uniref:Uncharacterized protein n=1 Tax=Petrolisthes manimaculis TaxID=1843537 RepID=A0AAE1QKJ8_9EUCA|nr:hypothetical protein Pmani_002310 [Petrolisthes manimaculis]
MNWEKVKENSNLIRKSRGNNEGTRPPPTPNTRDAGAWQVAGKHRAHLTRRDLTHADSLPSHASPPAPPSITHTHKNRWEVLEEQDTSRPDIHEVNRWRDQPGRDLNRPPSHTQALNPHYSNRGEHQGVRHRDRGGWHRQESEGGNVEHTAHSTWRRDGGQRDTHTHTPHFRPQPREQFRQNYADDTQLLHSGPIHE